MEAQGGREPQRRHSAYASMATPLRLSAGEAVRDVGAVVVPCLGRDVSVGVDRDITGNETRPPL
jgi:hypothetical protein